MIMNNVDVPKEQTARINWGQIVGKAANGAKSIFEPIMPATTTTISSTTSVMRDMRNATRVTRTTTQRQQSDAKNSSDNRRSVSLFKSAFDDIQTGNFTMEKINNDLFDDYESATEESFKMPSGDDVAEMSSEEILLIGNKGVAQSIIQSSSAQLRGLQESSKALISANIKSTQALGLSINNTLRFGFGSINANLVIQNQKLDSINKNISGLLEFNNTNALEFYSKSIDMMAGIGKMMNNLEKSMNPDSRKKDRVFDTSGGLNLREYVNYVKEGIKESMLGATASTVKNTGKDYGIMGVISDLLIPKAIKEPLEKFDKSLTKFFNEGFKRLGEELNKNDLFQMFGLGDIFGSKRAKINSIELGKYMKDATPWNGVAQKALVEVIPELLTSIDSKIDNSEKRYYDYNKGQFKTRSKIEEDFRNEYFDTFSVMLRDSMEKLSEVSQATGRADSDKLILAIQGIIDDHLSGAKDEITSRREMSAEMKRFGVDDTGIKDFIMEFTDGLDGAISKINDLYHEIGSTQHIYRNINNSNGREYTRDIKSMHKRRSTNYRSYSFVDSYKLGNDPISIIQELQRKLNNTDIDVSSDTTLQQTIFALMQSNAKESDLIKAVKDAVTMKRESAKMTSKFKIAQKFKSGAEKLGSSISRGSENILNPVFRTVYLDEWQRPAQDNAEPQLSSETVNSKKKSSAPKRQKRALTSMFKKNIGVSSREERSFEQIDELNQTEYGKIIDKTESENDRDHMIVSRALGELAQTQPSSTLEGTIMQSNNALKSFLSALMFNFKGFTSRLFGKEGFFKKIWESDARKKATDNIKEKLFTGENAIFKNQYEGAKSGLKHIKDKTIGYLGKGYDFLYDNTMQYMYGGKDELGNDISYKDSESWKSNTALSQTLNREWRAEQKKLKTANSPVADIAPKEIKESTSRITDGISTAAEGVVESAENLENNMEAFIDATVGDSSKSPNEKKRAYSNEFMKKIKSTMPKALASAVAGAGVGLLNNQFSLLGSMFLPGGPVAGAIVGGGLSILSQTEAFKTFMFGKLGEDGKTREGGLISQELKAKFTKMLPYAVGGAVLGGLKGLVKGALGFDGGLGVLGMQILPGGILGGALLGAGMGILKNSEGFKKMLFGEKDENGKRSGKFLSDSFNKVKGSFSKMMPSLKKAGTGLGIGALSGAVLSSAGYLPAMLSLGGPVGMGIAGLGLGIASSTKKFNEWMFGSEELDEDGNPTGKRRKDGMLTRVTNLLNTNVIEPISDTFKSKMLDLVDWTKDKVTYPFRLAFGPIMDSLVGIKDNVVDFVKDKFDALGNGIMDMMRNTMKSLFSPVTKVIGFVGKSLIGVASSGAKLAMAPLSLGLQAMQVLTAGKRRKEYVDFYKNYYSKGNITGALRDKWEADAEGGKSRNIFGKLSDTIGAFTGHGEIADAARTGWNNQMEAEGKNHLNWRSVHQEKRAMHSQRDQRHANEKQWKKIDSYRNKIIRKDLNGREVTLNDYQFERYRDKFKKLGISEEYLQSSDDIMDLLYRRDSFKKKLDPTGNSGGLVIEETPAQKEAREKTEAYQEHVKTILDKVAERMGIAAKDLIEKKAIKSATEEWNDDKKKLAKRLKKANIKNINIDAPELQDFDINEVDSDRLSDYRYSKYYKSGDFLGFLKAFKITQKSQFKSGLETMEENPVIKEQQTATEVLTKMNEQITDLVQYTKEQTDINSAQLAATTGMNTDDVSTAKKKGKGFGSYIKKKFSPITQLIGFGKKKAKKNAEASESDAAREGTDSIFTDDSDEIEPVEEKSGFGKIWDKIKSIGALIGTSTIGGLLFKGIKVAGTVGLLGSLGLSIAELIRPGTAKQIGAKIDAFTDYVTDDEFTLKKVFTDFGNWFNDSFIGNWWEATVKPWWNDSAWPTIRKIPEIIITNLPNMIRNTGELIANNADKIIDAFTAVISEIGVPLTTAIVKGTPEILGAVVEGSWEVLKALGNEMLKLLGFKSDAKGDISEAGKSKLENTGTQVATETVGSVHATNIDQAVQKAKEEYGLTNPQVTYNTTTGEYDVKQNVVSGKNIARDAKTGEKINVGGVLNNQLIGSSTKLGAHVIGDSAFNLYGGRGKTAGKIALGAIQTASTIGGKALQGIGMVGKNTLGKIPLIGLPFKAGGAAIEGAGKLLEFGAHPINNAKAVIEKISNNKLVNKIFGSRATVEAAADVVTEEGSEIILNSVAKASTEKIGETVIKETQQSTLETLMKKISKWLADVATNKTISAAVGKLGMNATDSIMQKLAKFLVNTIDTIIANSAKCTKKLIDLATAAITKVTGKLGLAAGTVGIAEFIGIGVGGVFGAIDAANLFQTKDPDWVMRGVSSVIEALLGSSIGGAIDFLFEAVRLVGDIAGKDWNFKKDIAEFLYKLLCGYSDEAINKLEVGQAALEAEKDVYNALNNTNLSTSSYNEESNKTFFGKMLDGGKNIVNWGANLFGKDNVFKTVDTSSAENVRKALNAAGYTDAQISEWARNDTAKLDAAIKSVGYGPDNRPAKINGLYAQGDSRWAKMPIGTLPDGSVATMDRAGCGPTALAAVANTVAARSIGYGPMTPADIAAYAASNGYISQGGANAGLFTEGAAKLGLSSSPISNASELRDNLLAGKPTILTGKSNDSSDPYTSSGHIVMADGIAGNKMRVLDPITGKYKMYDMNAISKNTEHAWSYSAGYGPYYDALSPSERAQAVKVANGTFDISNAIYSPAYKEKIVRAAYEIKNDPSILINKTSTSKVIDTTQKPTSGNLYQPNAGIIDYGTIMGYNTGSSGIDMNILNNNYDYFIKNDMYYRKNYRDYIEKHYGTKGISLQLKNRSGKAIKIPRLKYILSTQYFGLNGGSYGSITIKPKIDSKGKYKSPSTLTKDDVTRIYAAAIISENNKGNKFVGSPLSDAEKFLALCNACRVMFGLANTLVYMTNPTDYYNKIHMVKDDEYTSYINIEQTVGTDVTTELNTALVETNSGGIKNAEELTKVAKQKNLLGKIGLIGKILKAKINSMLGGSDFWTEFANLTTTDNSTGPTNNENIILSGASSSLHNMINNPNNIQEELLGKTIENIYREESGGNYAAVTNDTNNLSSVGPYQANGINAYTLLKDLEAAQGIPSNLRKTFGSYANIIRKPMTADQRADLSAALANSENSEIIKKVIDRNAMKFQNQWFRHHYSGYYDNGIIKDLRTLPLLADIGNTGPALIWSKSKSNSFISNWTPVSKEKDFEAAYNLLNDTRTYWKNSKYSNSYMKRVKNTYDNLKNYTFKKSVAPGQLSKYFAEDTNPLGFGPTSEKLQQFNKILSTTGDALINYFSKKTGLSASDLGVSVTDSTADLDYIPNEIIVGDGISQEQLTSLSGSDRDRFIAAAKSQIGYLEKSNGSDLKSFKANPGKNSYTKYAQEIGGWNGPGAHWCNFFTSWAGKAAGIPKDIIYRNGSCTNTKNYYANQGRYKSAKNYRGQLGDLVFFDWEKNNKPNHIGIVTASDGDNLYTIEGNTSTPDGYDGTTTKIRNFSSGNIMGFATPKWTGENKQVNPSTLLSLGYGPKLKTSKIDSPAYREQLRKSIDNQEEFKVTPKDFEAVGFGPGMPVDAGFDMTSTDGKLDQIFGVIAEWFAESKKNKAADSSATTNVNMIRSNTTNVAPSTPRNKTTDVQKYRENIVNQHVILSSKTNVRNTI